MPIRPENRHHYRGKAWKDLREQILERAGNCCENCGVPNHAVGHRYKDGAFLSGEQVHELIGKFQKNHLPVPDYRVIRIVLTISHQDHNPENNDPGNLKALCQRCHNRHDIKFRQANREATLRMKAGQLPLEGI